LSPASQGLEVRFWGTRGSLPAPGQATVRAGGNTSCVQVQAGDTCVVFDAGSGLRELGRALGASGPVRVHLLVSHYHWDHIMGLPFFEPLYRPDTELHFVGEPREGRGIEQLLKGQMVHPYFPVSMPEGVQAQCRHTDLRAGEGLSLPGGVSVQTTRLFHPGDSMAYRLEFEGRAVVYATDVEHHPDHDAALVELARGADLLIYDATYTEGEYQDHVGWGHSTWEAGVRAAQAAGVQRLAIFHHLPERDDDALDAIEAQAQALFAGAFVARDGQRLSF